MADACSATGMFLVATWAEQVLTEGVILTLTPGSLRGAGMEFLAEASETD